MYKVLIVDDEPFILEGLRHMIDWEGLDFEIAGEASYGCEALEIINQSRISILITDIKMPFMDGFELIKEIRDRNLDIKCIILSGYDDFAYVKEAVKLGIENYILKPVSKEELIATLISTRAKIESDLLKQNYMIEGVRVLRNNILNRWMMNKISRKELVERMSLLNMNLPDNEYMVSAFKFSSNSKSDQMCDSMVNLLQGESIDAITYCDTDGDVIAVFFGISEVKKKIILSKVLPGCREKLAAEYSMGIYITVGSCEYGLENAHKSYRIAKDLQDYHLILPSSTVISYNDVAKSASDGKMEFNIDYDMLCGFIISQKRVEALAFVDDFYMSLQDFSGLTPSSVYNATIEMLFSITRTIRKLRGSFEAFEDLKSLYVKMFRIKNARELAEWLKTVIISYMDNLQLDDDKSCTLIQKILIYIDESYSKDINLKTIASVFNNNPAYLGQAFKKEMRESFTSYLNKVRVEKAKELLMDGTMKIGEISRAVGYYNYNYFFTIFKRITGISPNEFADSSGKHNI